MKAKFLKTKLELEKQIASFREEVIYIITSHINRIKIW